MSVKSIKGLKEKLAYLEKWIESLQSDLKYSEQNETANGPVYRKDLEAQIGKYQDQLCHTNYDLTILEAAQK